MSLDPDLLQSAPDLVISGRRIHFVWQCADPLRPPYVPSAPPPSIPRGVLIRHPHQNPVVTSECVVWVPWVRRPDEPADAPVWTLLSLRPLSIAEPFSCQRCGAMGGIREGRWWMGVS